jgi:hypothetical protein
VLKIGRATESIEVALGAALAGLPGRVRGTVRSEAPWSRLGVVSLETAGGNAWSGLILRGPTTSVAHDGSYELAEPVGERTVVVFDLSTGAILGVADPGTVTAGGERRVDLVVDATAVEVAVGGPGFCADRSYTLEVRPRQSPLPPGVGGLHLERMDVDRPGRYCGMGCRLAIGERRVQLLLPHGAHVLRLLPTSDENRTQEQFAQLATAAVDVGTNPLAVALELPAAK